MRRLIGNYKMFDKSTFFKPDILDFHFFDMRREINFTVRS